jgi:small subunit ribosomal protein S4
MGRSGTPRNKVSRRFGFDVYGTGGRSLERRIDTPPGAARGRRRRRPSAYAEQLTEKQKVRAIYGVDERPFRRQFELASRSDGPPGANLLIRMERRLDNVVYRLGFARTRRMARQLVGHGHVLVDEDRLDIPSALVEAGQTVRVSEAAARFEGVIGSLAERRPVPGWLEAPTGAPLTGRVVRLPEREDIEYPIDESLVVAFYSR